MRKARGKTRKVKVFSTQDCEAGYGRGFRIKAFKAKLIVRHNTIVHVVICVSAVPNTFKGNFCNPNLISSSVVSLKFNDKMLSRERFSKHIVIALNCSIFSVDNYHFKNFNLNVQVFTSILITHPHTCVKLTKTR